MNLSEALGILAVLKECSTDVKFDVVNDGFIYVFWRGFVLACAVLTGGEWRIGHYPKTSLPLTKLHAAQKVFEGLPRILVSAKPEDLPALQAFAQALCCQGKALHSPS